MTAELAARRTAAAAVLADFRRWDRGELILGDWQVWSLRLAAELAGFLDIVGGWTSLSADELRTVASAQ